MSQLTNRLKRAVGAAFPMANPIIRHKTGRAIITAIKDQLPVTSQSSVVYQFKCDCQQDYIGRTEATLSTRIGQHIPKWLESGKKSRPRSTQLPSSSIAKHIMQCDAFTQPSTDHFGIIHKGHHPTTNRILEAIEIKLYSPTLCVQKDRLFELKIPWL